MMDETVAKRFREAVQEYRAARSRYCQEIRELASMGNSWERGILTCMKNPMALLLISDELADELENPQP